MRKRPVLIETKNLKRHYRDGKILTKALNGVDIKIYKGEFLGIMGPSGSGKSTLLHLLGLLDKPTEGKILFQGKRIDSLNENEKYFFRLEKIGYVFQQYRLIPEFNAYENVMLPMLMKEDDFEKAKRKAISLLTKIGLGNRVSHYPFELSGGEQQRVAIARALINNPSIIYADEPTANLDTSSGIKIMHLFKELNKKYNHTVVVVSHEVEHKKFFERIIYLKDGKIEREEVVNHSK